MDHYTLGLHTWLLCSLILKWLLLTRMHCVPSDGYLLRQVTPVLAPVVEVAVPSSVLPWILHIPSAIFMILLCPPSCDASRAGCSHFYLQLLAQYLSCGSFTSWWTHLNILLFVLRNQSTIVSPLVAVLMCGSIWCLYSLTVCFRDTEHFDRAFRPMKQHSSIQEAAMSPILN